MRHYRLRAYACDDFCGFSHGEPHTRYKWSYTNNNGTTSSGEFDTNEYGQATFDVPEDTDCNRVEVKKMESPAFEEDAGPVTRGAQPIRKEYDLGSRLGGSAAPSG